MTFIIGTGRLHAAHAAEVAVQRQAGFFGRGAGHGHDTASMALAPRRLLLSVPSRSIRVLSRKACSDGVQAQHGLGDFGVDVLHGLEHALAQVAALVAVAQLDGLAAAGGGARRHGGAAHGAGFQQHVAFDGGVAAAVEDLAADDVNDGAHGVPFFSKVQKRFRRPRRPACA
jgi:hypothetical protein